MASTQRGINYPVEGDWATKADLADDFAELALSADSALGGVAGYVTAVTDAIAGGYPPPSFHTANNLLDYADFRSGITGWQYYGSESATVSDGRLFVTGAGTISHVGIYPANSNNPIGVEGHIYYFRCVMATTSSGATSLRAWVQDKDGNASLNVVRQHTIPSPDANTPYVLSDTMVAPPEWDGEPIDIYMAALWANAGTADDKVTWIQAPIFLDLTQIYGAGNEPSKADMDAIIAGLPAGGATSRAQSLPSYRPPVLVNWRNRVRETGGPRVIWRFDDGYQSVLDYAAPILAAYGMAGTLFTGTHPTDWLGTTQPGGKVMTASGLRELHEKYGWEIGSHTREHVDAIDNPTGFVTSVDQSITDIINYGLPRPVSFAYPNGSRTDESDRQMYRRFNHIALTGGPEHSPLPVEYRSPFLTWAVIPSDGTRDAMLARAKAYVEMSFQHGRHAVLGFHGFAIGTPGVSYNLDVETFKTLVQWVAEQGFPHALFRDLPAHNLVADPGFEQFTLGYPWSPEGAGGWARSTTGPDHGTYCCRFTGSTSDKNICQRIPVRPGVTYRAYMRVNVPLLTAGSVLGYVEYQDFRRKDVGSFTTLFTISATTSGYEDFTATFTPPDGAQVARVGLRLPNAGFTGDVRFDHMAVYEANGIDPLAPSA